MRVDPGLCKDSTNPCFRRTTPEHQLLFGVPLSNRGASKSSFNHEKEGGTMGRTRDQEWGELLQKWVNCIHIRV